jgi:hypothetical protein
MAFSGLHVTCGIAGPMSNRSSMLSLMGKVLWSQTLPSAGTTTETAPDPQDRGNPMFQVRAAADSFVAIAPAPNATTGPRIFVPAGERIEFYGEPGDKLAWVAA